VKYELFENQSDFVNSIRTIRLFILKRYELRATAIQNSYTPQSFFFLHFFFSCSCEFVYSKIICLINGTFILSNLFYKKDLFLKKIGALTTKDPKFSPLKIRIRLNKVLKLFIKTRDNEP